MSKLIVIDFTPRVPKYISRLLPFIESDFDEVIIFSNKKQLFDKLSTKVRFISLNNSSENKVVKLILYLGLWIMLLYYSFLNSRKIKVIHFQFLPLYEFSNIEIYLLKLLKSIVPKVFYTVHNLLPHDSNHKLDRWMLLYSQFSCLFVHDEYTKSILIQRLGGTVNIAKIVHPPLYQTVISKKLLANKTRPLRLLLFGFLEPYKGCETYLHLAKSFGNNCDFEFIIAGQIREEYKYYLSSKNLLELSNVKYKFGYLSDKELQYQISISDVVLFPFDRITTSGSFMTVLNQFKCVLANDLPFFREILEDDKQQICDFNNISEVQKRLNSMKVNREVIRDCENKNYKLINEKYSWDKCAYQHMLYYKN
jgi:glycosyltransferase involved in cell wall biosynthesis